MSSLSAALQRLAISVGTEPPSRPVSGSTPLPIVAGGTDFYPALGDASAPDDVLSLHGIEELVGVRHLPDAIEIGSGTTWRALLEAPLPAAFDGLKAAAREVGSVQIQSRGTLAGNLCTASPAADGVPPLLALGARVTLASVRGRRSMPVENFLLGPRRTARAADEVLVAIAVPTPRPGTVSAFYKLGSRRYLVISIAMLACTLRSEGGRLRDVRIAVGACSPVARRLTGLERALEDMPTDDAALCAAIDESLSSGALEVLQPIDDVRASAAYRRDAVAGALGDLLRRTTALARAAAASTGSRSHGR